MTRCGTMQEFDLEMSRLERGQSADLSDLDVERLFGRGDIAWARLGKVARAYSCILIRQPGGASLIKVNAGGPRGNQHSDHERWPITRRASQLRRCCH
jgi:hypothetical protein